MLPSDVSRSDPATMPAGPKPAWKKFLVKGMTCRNCARHVSEAVSSVSDVECVDVDLETGMVQVRWLDGRPADDTLIVKAIEKAGFNAQIAPNRSPSKSFWDVLSGWQLNVYLGAICTLPLILGEWFLGWHGKPWFGWLGFGLALMVQSICGARFYIGAWNQLKTGNSNMDTLVSLGSSTAFGFSAWGLFSGQIQHYYFMESAAIITVISLGHWMESLASARAEGSLRALLQLTPPKARQINETGEEKEVDASSLLPGNRVSIRPGDRVPADGVVDSGHSAVDESMMTGESLPVDKKIGSPVYAGTLNRDGHLTVRVNVTGEETAVAHIIEVVQRAQASRASIQRLGDRVGSVFVPVVVLLAILTGIMWAFAPTVAGGLQATFRPYLWPFHPVEGALASAFIYAAGVLIVACPCAMGLATPAVIMAAANAGARRGILIRDGVALEKSGIVNTVLFDKTGTLTRGMPSVADMHVLVSAPDIDMDMKALAASLAQPSNHPLSQAIAELTKGNISLEQWREHRGSGVEAYIKHHGAPMIVRLGSLNWLSKEGVDWKKAGSFIDEWRQKGASLIGLTLGVNALAVFALKDTLKPFAASVIADLKAQDKTIYMVTGDHQLTAMALAEELGIAKEHVYAEIRPENKASIVRQLQEKGLRVAFVGDGINDAPALEQSDLGIAVSRASDVAREAADVVLLNSDIQTIPEALCLAQTALRIIKQNLFWAFIYNAMAVPLAMFGFLSPILCAAAMGFSDVAVIGNALRLMRWKYRRM